MIFHFYILKDLYKLISIQEDRFRGRGRLRGHHRGRLSRYLPIAPGAQFIQVLILSKSFIFE